MKAAYFSMDTPPTQVTDSEQFQQLINFYTIEWNRVIEKGTRSLYMGIIGQESYFFPSNTIPSIFQVFAQYNPHLIWAWDEEGTPMGTLKRYNENGEKYYDNYPTFDFDDTDLLSFISPKITHIYEEEQFEYTYEVQVEHINELDEIEIITETRTATDVRYNIVDTIETEVTVPYFPNLPNGWTPPAIIKYDENYNLIMFIDNEENISLIEEENEGEDE